MSLSSPNTEKIEFEFFIVVIVIVVVVVVDIIIVVVIVIIIIIIILVMEGYGLEILAKKSGLYEVPKLRNRIFKNERWKYYPLVVYKKS